MLMCICTPCLTAGLSSQGRRQLEKWSGLASRIEFVARNKLEPNSYIWTLLSFDFCMCNTAYNLKAVFSSRFSIIINFGCPFMVTAFTHKNMRLKSGGGGGGGGSSAPLPTPLHQLSHIIP